MMQIFILLQSVDHREIEQCLLGCRKLFAFALVLSY